MTEEFRQRSDILGTQVITRTAGKRLGVVSQLWVDIDRQEVVALSLRPNLFYGTPQPMMLSSIRQIGDVILVDDDNVIEDVDLEAYSNLVGCEVITETGELLGKVRGFRFDIDSGKVDTLVIASIGLPLIPDQIVSTYELPIDEVVSSGPDRLIVYEGSEDRMTQITVGVLERLGLGKAPWEREEEGQYLAPIRTENQLPSGQQVPMEAPPRRAPVVEETWDEDTWEPEPIQRRQPEPEMRQAELYPPVYDEPVYREPTYSEPAYSEPTYSEPVYDEDEADNWTTASNRDAYLPQADYPNGEPSRDRYEDEPEYDEDFVDEDVEDIEVDFVEIEEPATPTQLQLPEPPEDPWAEKTEDDYQPQELKLPEKQKEPEYEEEGY
ncbi:PRC-barrel domain-containing protein [Myxacorys almedinensis]|uniref:Photosystem reaction center subunit H n=1 Tax=Myxacorys almedinensis A TaxID=2690445 RepID=A0A8J8CLG5_9CYAN|nr:PRC-barrel domain-containing protein [Myxacorys almedinensis]NDJ17735.1 photosystem reaction center subunit H [Myxacorys almedinensis A]